MVTRYELPVASDGPISLICVVLDLHYRESQSFLASFHFLNHLIENFRTTLPPLSGLDANSTRTRTIVLTHALTDAAVIKLHNPFASTDLISKQNCLAAARAMVRFGSANVQDFHYLNPIMGVSAVITFLRSTLLSRFVCFYRHCG